MWNIKCIDLEDECRIADTLELSKASFRHRYLFTIKIDLWIVRLQMQTPLNLDVEKFNLGFWIKSFFFINMYKMVIESKALSGNTVYMFSRGVYAIIFIIRKGKNETFVLFTMIQYINSRI
jgi:hypothetical protein